MLRPFACQPFVLLCILLLAWTGPAAAVELPSSPGGRHLAAYLEAMAADDPAIFQRLIDEHLGPSERPRAERLADLEQAAAMIGAVEVHSILDDAPERIEILARRQRDGRWMKMALDLDRAPPHRIVGLGMMPAAPPADLDLPARTEAEAVAALVSFIEQQVAEDRFSGAVRLARGDEVLFEGAWGQAERRFGIDNKTSTKLNLGSMNKMFTAVAIGQLVDAGKLSFDDRLIDVMPDYPNPAVAKKVTLHHLLTHSSGLGSYWGPLFATDWTKIRSHQQLLDLFADASLDFEPGERFQYSNSGFVVLGRVIEAVTGMSYFDYVRQKIFLPAGMTSTDSYAYDDVVPDLATGYTRMGIDGTRSDGPRRSNVFAHSAKGSAAGGGYSTVGDLHRFARALAGDKLLRPATRERLHSPQAPVGGSYGYGFGNHGEGRMRYTGHNGGGPGISADFRWYPETDYSVAVLANLDPGAAGAVSEEIHLLLQSIR